MLHQVGEARLDAFAVLRKLLHHHVMPHSAVTVRAEAEHFAAVAARAPKV
jgi:hypothetical protein